MTDQELRKLSRKDLLELLLAQEQEKNDLLAALEKARAELRNRQIRIEQAGSLAEAALQLNGVFDAAQAAAQQYLENIRQRSEQIEMACAKREAACAQREKESREKINHDLKEAEQTAQNMVEEAKRKSMVLMEEAKEKSEAYWREISQRLNAFYQEHEELKKLLARGEQK